MKKNYLAHAGESFTIEWYFDNRGYSDSSEYFNQLPLSQKKKFIHLLYLLGDMGKIHNEEKFRYEGDQIYAFKPSPDRFLCFFFQDKKVIITNAYMKKTNKMPAKEKEKALKARNDYIKRFNGGTYYE